MAATLRVRMFPFPSRRRERTSTLLRIKSYRSSRSAARRFDVSPVVHSISMTRWAVRDHSTALSPTSYRSLPSPSPSPSGGERKATAADPEGVTSSAPRSINSDARTDSNPGTHVARYLRGSFFFFAAARGASSYSPYPYPPPPTSSPPPDSTERESRSDDDDDSAAEAEAIERRLSYSKYPRGRPRPLNLPFEDANAARGRNDLDGVVAAAAAAELVPLPHRRSPASTSAVHFAVAVHTHGESLAS
mmetsp:Transcript_55204/g.165381  ORF Transcript_55204/g.165381 Transcript_55204/m.165381 type:complete len:247 (+) Transcript_55204:296-1036(+)